MSTELVEIHKWDQLEAEIRHKVHDRTYMIDAVYQPGNGPVKAAIVFHPEHMCVHQMVEFLQEHIRHTIQANPEAFEL